MLMNILSVICCGVLAFFLFQGEPPELYAWEMGISLQDNRLSVFVDPVFVVWAARLPSFCKAMTVGNVMLIRKTHQSTLTGEYALRYEYVHVQQFFALGLLYPLAALLSPALDPLGIGTTHIPTWNTPEEINTFTWIPSPNCPRLWHFLTIPLK